MQLLEDIFLPPFFLRGGGILNSAVEKTGLLLWVRGFDGWLINGDGGGGGC